MTFIQEYSLLIAVALPLVTIVAANVMLAASGERGTLLLPLPMSFPSRGEPVTVVREVSTQRIDTDARVSANEELELLAA